MNDIRNLIIILVIMGILDYIWLGIIQSEYISAKIADINRTSYIEHPPITFATTYLLMGAGLYYFVLRHEEKSAKELILEAMFLGLVIYTTFDFSMLNLVRRWTMYDALKDIAWGTFMFGATAAVYLGISGAIKSS